MQSTGSLLRHRREVTKERARRGSSFVFQDQETAFKKVHFGKDGLGPGSESCGRNTPPAPTSPDHRGPGSPLGPAIDWGGSLSKLGLRPKREGRSVVRSGPPHAISSADRPSSSVYAFMFFELF
ncbi:hypothetical protein NL676_014890 [Syzygium grande]|nr:hypothetical protein NL676_014890 [Syzygium grande]